jgi:hypothetical protein
VYLALYARRAWVIFDHPYNAEYAPSRPGTPGGPPGPGPRSGRPARPSPARGPGAYWGHAPDHRDNRRRDPRRIACLHGCGQDRCHAQDVSHHRADRDSRRHHRVARGQAPSSRLARRSRCGHPMPAAARRYPAGPQTPDSNRLSGDRLSGRDHPAGASIATKDTPPAVMADSGSPSGPAWPSRRSPRSSAVSRAATRLAGTTGRSPAGSARSYAC